jgi:hypothetical protein
MLASMAVTAAEPSGLWGLLKESFAASGAMARIKSDAGANELIKAVVAEFETSEGRGIARDGLQARLSGSKPDQAATNAIEGLRQVAALLDARRRPMPPRSRPGSRASASMSPRPPRKAAFSGSAASRSARRRKRRSPRSRPP